jgi:hypothetical protein
VIFTTTVHPDHAGTLPMLIESRSGALDTLPVREAIARMRQLKPVVVLSRTGRRILARTGSGKVGELALPVLPQVA